MDKTDHHIGMVISAIKSLLRDEILALPDDIVGMIAK